MSITSNRALGVWLALSKLDHPGREVHANDLSAGRDLLREAPAQRSGAAREVQDAHSRLRVDQLEDSQPPARFAPRHDLLEAALICERMAAEDRRKQLLGLHGVRFRHSCSSHIAALSAPALVRPTTCMPTGSPRTGRRQDDHGLSCRVERPREPGKWLADLVAGVDGGRHDCGRRQQQRVDALHRVLSRLGQPRPLTQCFLKVDSQDAEPPPDVS